MNSAHFYENGHIDVIANVGSNTLLGAFVSLIHILHIITHLNHTLNNTTKFVVSDDAKKSQVTCAWVTDIHSHSQIHCEMKMT